MPNSGEAKPGDGKPADPNKPKEGEKKDGPQPVTARPAKPATPPNPDELKNLKPDENGQVKFNLKGQPWPDVLEWLAETSHKSLDWQELPNDYLNLVTQQSYSIDEASDLINRHLLARGFTMIAHGETISVVAVSKINPGMVPRVEPTELAKLPDHDFVKTSFSLDWLLANEAEEEFKPMLSPNGKLTHLAATNRLEAMDSVLNLRQIWTVIQEEQSGGKQERLVREFKLKHTKSGDVLDQLYAILGINKPPSLQKRRGSSSGGSYDPNMMNQFQQAMQQLVQPLQQMAQNQGQGAGAKARKPGEVRIIANEKENSILANAPPDKMAIIAQAIKTLDVEREGENLLQNVQRMQVYRLTGVDPESLVQLLDEVGNLDPTTKLQIDTKNKSIVAYASLADHLTIKMLVEKLDGTSRKFQVIPLRKLGADYVAGSIEFMMGGGEKDKSSSRSNPFYFDFYDPYGGRRSSSQSDSTDKFRVDADVENNRLLLWANEIELREIENLLVKLGELPPPGGNRNTQRYLDNLDPEDAEQLLDRVRRLWPGIAPNELIIEGAEPPRRSKPARPTPPADDKTPSPTSDAPKADARPALPAQRTAVLTRPRDTTSQVVDRFDELLARADAERDDVAEEASSSKTPSPRREADTSDDATKAEHPDSTPSENRSSRTRPAARDDFPNADATKDRTPAPIRIRRTPDGKLVMESEDTEALDRLEDLLHEAAPPRRDYKVFYLKYPTTWAYSIELNLKDFFKEEEKKSNSGFNPYFGYRYGGNENTDTARRLSKKKPLKFISDSDSGTIIVQGADAQQLKIIEELINIYDQPLATDGKQVRKTQTFTLKYSKATVVAEAIKDVYRDLLSANDKAYQNQQTKDGQKPPERNYTFVYGASGGGDDKKGQQETPVKFKGLLSVGVDDISNTIIVSAPESLLENVSELIEQLDQAARPTNSVQVLQVDGKVNSAELQKRLAKIFTKPQQQRPQQPQRPNQGQPQQHQEQNAEEPLVVP